VNKSAFLTIGLLLTLLSAAAFQVPGQQSYPKGMSPPPSPMNPDNASANQTADEPKLSRKIDLVQLQREADDLAREALTIPSDVASVRRGEVPKDVIQKLKQIEKLSKHLRSELNP